MLTIARIRNGVVVNIEMASQDWIDAYDGPDLIVPYTADQPANVGLGYDPVTGFEQPPAPEPQPEEVV